MMVEGTLLRWSYLSPSSLLSRSAKFNSGGGSTRSRIRRGTGGVRKLRFHPSSLSYVSLSLSRERERKSKVYSFVARAFPLEKGYIPTQREKIVRWTPLENSQAQWVLDVIIEVEKFQLFEAFLLPPLWPSSSKNEIYSPDRVRWNIDRRWKVDLNRRTWRKI